MGAYGVVRARTLKLNCVHAAMYLMFERPLLELKIEFIMLPLDTELRTGGTRYRQCSNIEVKLCPCRHVLDV